MDLILDHESFLSNEIAFDGSSEQSVELDYILPDYLPDIFRILKCSFYPKVISHSVVYKNSLPIKRFVKHKLH